MRIDLFIDHVFISTAQLQPMVLVLPRLYSTHIVLAYLMHKTPEVRFSHMHLSDRQLLIDHSTPVSQPIIHRPLYISLTDSYTCIAIQ